MSLRAPAYDPEKAHAFFTLSIPIEGEELSALINGDRPSTAGKSTWDKSLLDQIQRTIAESQDLQSAINPMFDDIADRDRSLFVKDFLLDTPNETNASTPTAGAPDKTGEPIHMRNVCACVELDLQDTVHWLTEGVRSEVELSPPIAFVKVLCRAFWMVHSNDALSYHLSFEVPFDRGLKDFYGLAMLLKAFIPSEGTEWVLGSKGWIVGQPSHPNKPKEELLSFIEELFKHHTRHLFGKLASKGWISQTVATAVTEQAWQRLVLRRGNARAGEPAPRDPWRNASRRRLLVMLRDEALFEIVDRACTTPELLRSLRPLKVEAGVYQWGSLQEHFKSQADALKSKAQERGLKPFTPDEIQAVVFLSGFFQNVVDFLEQDDLEVHDGISPLYPSQEDGAGNDGYRVYATPRIMFEMVGTSRSLDHAGRKWLGTCPYLFLVHVMALHNEGIVLTYERRVSELIRDLEALGIRSDVFDVGRRSRMQLRPAFEKIKRFRLATFEQVHKHLSFNVFRYETEQTFFRRLEDLRGTAARQAYWDRVLEHLMETVDSLNADNATRHGLVLSTLGFFLALSGLLQLLFAVFPPMVKVGEAPEQFTPTLSLGFGIAGGLVLALCFYIYLRKRWNPSST